MGYNPKNNQMADWNSPPRQKAWCAESYNREYKPRNDGV
jgi:hypothetical protein